MEIRDFLGFSLKNPRISLENSWLPKEVPDVFSKGIEAIVTILPIKSLIISLHSEKNFFNPLTSQAYNWHVWKYLHKNNIMINVWLKMFYCLV